MSSVIARIHYEAETSELFIWFVPTGLCYVYLDVPEAIYEELAAAGSRGSFFNQHIRDHFEARQVEPSETLARHRRSLRS